METDVGTLPGAERSAYQNGYEDGVRSGWSPIVREVLAELDRATALFGPFHSAHEGYAVMLEEFEELWDEIKANNAINTRKEAIQVAAMALRFLMDVKFDGQDRNVK